MNRDDMMRASLYRYCRSEGRSGRWVVAALILWIGAGVVFAQAERVEPRALEYAGVAGLHAADPNLLGEDITIAAVCRSLTYVGWEPQLDYRVDVNHKCFRNALVEFPDGKLFAGSSSAHATAIGAILAGMDVAAKDGELGEFAFLGAAPKSRLQVHEFWHFVRDHIFNGEPLDADVVSLSSGVTFEDWWTRGLERLAERDGIVVVAGAGNGLSVHDPILYPAAGANVLGVGLVESTVVDGETSFSLPYSRTTSRGPTADARCKPDLVAPGNVPAPGVGTRTGYAMSGDGSSFAAPVVAGAAALLLEAAQRDPQMREVLDLPGANCLVKAVLMNSARKLPFWHKGDVSPEDDGQNPLDWLQGAGLVDGLAAHRQLAAGQGAAGYVAATGWDLSEIERDARRLQVYHFTKPADEDTIVATLVWNRHLSEASPFEAVAEAQSDLRLEVWAVDPEKPERDKLLAYSDSLVDNVEHVICEADPEYSEYEIVVAFGHVPDEASRALYPAEPYAVAWRTAERVWEQSPWWNDLNADGRVDGLDRLAFSLLDRMADAIEENLPFAEQVLKLSPKRVALLREYWPQWRAFTRFDVQDD